jgi:hypothetical protein
MAKKKTPAQSFAQFFALYMDKGATAGEREEAERRMNTWLARHGKTRADIPAILAQALADDAASQQPPPPSGRPHVNLLDLVDRIIELHVALTPQQRLATALWVLHTYVYDRFVCTPRLAFWRPLLAIADDLGRGVEAREAATVLQAGRSDEDQSVVLLRDIRSVFDRLGCEAIFSDDLVAALLALDEAPWSEWRGLTDDRPARPLTKNLLADLLRPFASSRSIWIGSKSLKGYRRPQFEAAWAAYCVGGQTSGRQTPIRAIT